MAIRKPIIVVSGVVREITSPDTIDPAVLPASTGGGISRPFVFFSS